MFKNIDKEVYGVETDVEDNYLKITGNKKNVCVVVHQWAASEAKPGTRDLMFHAKVHKTNEKDYPIKTQAFDFKTLQDAYFFANQVLNYQNVFETMMGIGATTGADNEAAKEVIKND